MHHGLPRSPFPRKARAPAIAALGIVFFTSAFSYAGEELAKDARFTLGQARKIALQARGGKVTDQELEKEPGGSGLRYSFDIRRGRITYEVGVDAKTGKILENKAEGPNPD